MWFIAKKTTAQHPLNPAQIKHPLKQSLDGDYPGLSGLSWSIGYLEQFLSILSEPLLIGCSALAVIDFITGGQLLNLPILMYLWASALAVAVTACFIVTWRRALRALSYNRYGSAFFLALLGVCLGLVDWTAVATQSLQQALHVSFVTALASLGFNVFWITNIRAAVAIAMAVVVAISNHASITTAQAPRRRLAFLDAALNKIAPVVNDDKQIEQPAQALSNAPAQDERETGDTDELPILSLVKSDENDDPLERVKQALAQEPNCSDRRLGRLSGLAPATAKKYRLMIEEELSA